MKYPNFRPVLKKTVANATKVFWLWFNLSKSYVKYHIKSIVLPIIIYGYFTAFYGYITLFYG